MRPISLSTLPPDGAERTAAAADNAAESALLAHWLSTSAGTVRSINPDIKWYAVHNSTIWQLESLVQHVLALGIKAAAAAALTTVAGQAPTGGNSAKSLQCSCNVSHIEAVH